MVVPTFNRERLLEITIPTYLQQDVEKLVLVDDCSTDATEQVARGLQARFPGRIEVLRNDTNRKQTYSKNRGISRVDTPYVYFGDDDSVLAPGSIAALLETSRERDAAVVGAAALYCRPGQAPEARLREYAEQEPTADPSQYVDLRRLRFCFLHRPPEPIELPALQASFLLRRDRCSGVSFDTRYTGNCFREETDFLLECKRRGERLWLEGRAVQINLAPELTAGGARSTGRLRYEWSSLVNTVRFLRKHRRHFECDLGVWHLSPAIWFARDRAAAALKRALP